jgi:aspartyl-tRNA synthetase
MVGGIDRYYQIATCWRDEDLRADRQFEFRQLDLELAFTTREEVMDVLERVVVASFEAVGRPAPERPFQRLSYADAMRRYGSDKPDTRFGLEIQDATDVTRGSEFGVFKNAECVRFLVAPAVFSRAELQRLEEFAKEWGAKGLAYVVVDESGELRSRSSSRQTSWPHSLRRPARRSSSRPTGRRWSSVSSARCAASSANGSA